MIGLPVLFGLIGTGAALYVLRSFAAHSSPLMRWLSFLGAAIFALMTLGAYLVNARPDLPGQSYNDRIEAINSLDPALLSVTQREILLRHHVRQSAKNGDAHAELARFLARSERGLEAITYFERALNLDPGPRVYSDLGQTLVVINDGKITPEAERAFQSAYQIDPSIPESAFFLGVAVFERGDRQQATRIWADNLAALNQNDPMRSLIALRAVEFLSQPRTKLDLTHDAIAQTTKDPSLPMAQRVEPMLDGLRAQLRDDPDHVSSWLVLARAEAIMGRYEQAYSTLDLAEDVFPEDRGALILFETSRALIQQAESQS